MTNAAPSAPSPFLEFSREEWAALRDRTPLLLTEPDIDRLRGLLDVTDVEEVRDVYLPLTQLLSMYVRATSQLRGTIAAFAAGARSGGADRQGQWTPQTAPPFVIGIAGSVSVGKSTFSRTLRELLAGSPDHPEVGLITTDGFLYPNAELERQGLMGRKGFPESYDQRAFLRFLSAVKSGQEAVQAPVYSHLVYDIVKDERVEVKRPDILLVEGLNLLQPARTRADGRTSLAVSDFLDFSIYLDARRSDLKRWYTDRFLALRSTAFSDPQSYFHRFASLSDDAARGLAAEIWTSINERNLMDNILPTRGRARLVLRKGADHRVERVRLRKP
ncbi:type I pantothenate kinase [Catenulispora sp. NF23]|uniref:Pantothenate kinase n=1 Tax=Catenulispora pinistramenti TaxID=2705254 RepID=A0ABS5L313_9ACTN|nr:type I pantothenate kinase [Catenulispora pinistramenti]MBS2536109.1 type I pantothenate kinase [Catenulispora pinistramenti]MBS2552619.1 type I pantothenate kinase [Catenulispora pinistramenti]